MNTETKTPVNAETIMVLPINKEKLNKHLTEQLHKKHKDAKGKNYGIRGKFALLKDKEDVLVESDACSQSLGEETTFEFHIYKENEARKGENGVTINTVSIFPSFDTEMSREELLPFCDKEISLKEFMGDRFRYNERICDNEQEFIEEIFGVKIPIPSPKRGRLR